MVNKLLQQQDITEPTHSCHRPVWSVKEPNSQWEVIVDYRNINPLSPQIPGNLPDVKDVFVKIRNYHPKFFGTIDLTDMSFSLPLHVDFRDNVTFT